MGRFPIKEFLAVCTMLILFGSCSVAEKVFQGGSSGASSGRKLLPIPVTVSFADSILNSNTDESTPLALVSTATNLFASVGGCLSGYTVSSTSITTGVVPIYQLDRSCVIKLDKFTFGSTTYSNAGVNVVDFTTWQVNDVATFQSTLSASDLIKVFVGTQVTQSGVLSTDTVSYRFTDIANFTTQSLSSANVVRAVPLTVEGAAAPNFVITEARLLSVNANGSGNLSFTLQCSDLLSGSSLPSYGCANSSLSGSNAILNSELDYIFIPDTYSQGTLTTVQVDAAFTSNTATAVGASIVAPGQQDLNGNTLTNGGFYTSNSSPLLTGTTPFSPSNLNYVFMLRRKNSSGITMSYIYYYIVLSATAPSSVSACGTSFPSGAGTVGNPYVVSTRTNLSNTVNCTSSSTYFIQVNDIDLGGSATPWAAINLWGQYNGAGYKITGMYQSVGSNGNIGLFANLQDGSSVSNLTLESVDLTGNDGGGGALGRTILGNVTNVKASGTINFGGIATNRSGGGLLGNMMKGFVSNSSSSVNITVTTLSTGLSMNFGGLIGRITSTNGNAGVSNSFATGNITTTNPDGTSVTSRLSFGGLIGQVLGDATNTMTISNSYSTGNLTMTSPTNNVIPRMGFIGLMNGATNLTSTVSGCFSKGTYTISGYSQSCSMGGIVGVIGQDSGLSISNSYTFATLNCGTSSTGTVETGGFAGLVNTTTTGHSISTSYSASPAITATQSGTVQGYIGSGSGNATLTNNFLYVNGNVTSQTITGLTNLTTSTQMQMQGTFTGFDFSTPVWKMPSANALAPSGLLSPVLAWQCGSNGIVCP